MARMIDRLTGLPLGDPEADPLGAQVPCEEQAIAAARRAMIVSASGWRTVFAADGDEESPVSQVSPRHLELTALAGAAVAEYFEDRLSPARRTVVLAVDSRPTGPPLAEVLIRVLLARGFAVRYLFISPIPEVIAYSASQPEVGAFLYVSASHNPVGHNGLKFGRAGEGVLPAAESRQVAAAFDRLCADPARRRAVAAAVRRVSPDAVGRVLEEVALAKPRALAAYRAFSLDVADGPVGAGTAAAAIAEGVRRAGCGIVVDFNGSARTTTADLSLLESLGIRTRALNATPREIAHQILPEGPGLDTAREALEEAAAADPRFSLAYVPDNDGDRGNMVFAGAETPLSAQEVFALAVVAELAWLSAAGISPREDAPWAVVVNGPTSLRVERIAAAFDTEVHRCEVGEANVVEAAARLRERGYLVRILGEGSNGGNILHPSRVRDPIATVFSFLKLLYAGRGTEADLFRGWCTRRGAEQAYRPDFTLEDVRRTLPRFRTTGTGEPGARLQVAGSDHAGLKRRYAQVFAAEWRKRRAELEDRYGIIRYEEIRYEGTESYVVGTGGETAAGPGGLKMQFYDAADRAVGFLWMRGSGTEPVFRAVVDIEGDDPEAEAELLAWHRRMIETADSTR
jgi:phosphoglucomutase